MPVDRHGAARAFIQEIQGLIPQRLQRAWLFGSVARGDAREESDVDVLLLVDARDPDLLRVVYRAAGRISRRYGVDVSVKVLGRKEHDASRGTSFLRHIESEGVALA